MLEFNVYSLFIKSNASTLVVGFFDMVDIEFNNPVTLFNPSVKEDVLFNMEFSNSNVVEEASMIYIIQLYSNSHLNHIQLLH